MAREENQKAGHDGAFDPLRFFFGMNYSDPAIAENPFYFSTIKYHELEHYYQIITTSFGFWYVHLFQSDKLIVLKSLIHDLKNNHKATEFLYPLSNWVRHERDPRIKETLASWYGKYLAYNRLDAILSGRRKVAKDDPTFIVFGLPKPIESVTPTTVDGDPIGYISILEGTAQIKSWLTLLNIRNFLEKDSAIQQWQVAMNETEKRLKTVKRYRTLLEFASELLDIDLFDASQLLRYAPLLRVAGDFALMVPVVENYDGSLKAWEEFHPGWRFSACLTAGKNFETTVGDDVKSVKLYYDNIINSTLAMNNWHGYNKILDSLIKLEQLNNEAFVDYSYILSSFKKSFATRYTQAYVFAWSDAFFDILEKNFPLPSVFHERMRAAGQIDTVRDRETFTLPFIIRPGLIEQLFEQTELVCPLSPETHRFPFKAINFINVSQRKCDFYRFKGSKFEDCLFRTLLKDIGLEPFGKQLRII